MAKIIVSGSVAYDRIMDYPGLFSDHILADKAHAINLSFQVERLAVEFGGTAGNVAYTLALLGESPEIIATVGNDFSQYKSHLMLAGIDPKTIHTVAEEPTASAFILTDSSDNQIAAFHMGAGSHAYDVMVDTSGRGAAIVSAGCISDMTALPSHYRKSGLKYLYDPGQAIPVLSADVIKDGVTGAYVLFASDYEMALINEKTGLSDNALLQLAENIVVTYGKDGSRLLTRENDWKILPVPVARVEDPTGAGDAFRAGFIKGMMMGLPLTTCAQLGSTTASFVVEVYGTQAHTCTLMQVADRYKTVFGESISLS